MSLLYVRHGATSLNKGGDQERLRGWLPAPLTMVGIRQAVDVAHRLPHVPFASFVHSDLPRASLTARIISQIIKQPTTADTDLRDWNTGDLAGQKVTDVLPELRKLIATPSVKAPHGEALNTYLARFVPSMRAKVADAGLHLVVGHARGSTILEGIADPIGGVGDKINPEYLYLRPHVHPGGILHISQDWQTSIENPPDAPRMGESQPSLGGVSGLVHASGQ